MNPPASLLSAAIASAVQSGVLHIEHCDPKFASDLTVVFDGQPVRKKFELLLTAVKCPRRATRGQRIVSSLRWDRDALVATSRIEAAGGGVTISFRYELRDGGRSLRAAKNSAVAAGTRTTSGCSSGRDQKLLILSDNPR